VRFEDKKAEAPHLAPLLELATIILACNNANHVQEEGTWKVVGDRTEGALLVAGIKAGGDRDGIEKELPKHHEFPFDSDRRLSTVIRKLSDGKLRAFINGAPDVLLNRCTNLYTSEGIRPMTDEDCKNILAQNTNMAQQALRVLGSAYRDLDNASPAELTSDTVEKDIMFMGLSGMYDPPRQQAKDAIEKYRAARIQVMMITGDHLDTATAIAHEIGIASAEDKFITGIELDKISDDDLRKRVPRITVYARDTAEHKLRIIRAWKANDAVVAMTGDGASPFSQLSILSS
jgi:P-type Ca2+ transporter type 2C